MTVLKKLGDIVLVKCKSELDDLVQSFKNELGVKEEELKIASVKRVIARSQGLKSYTSLCKKIPFELVFSEDVMKIIRGDLWKLYSVHGANIEYASHKVFGLKVIFNNDIKPLASTVIQLITRSPKPIYPKVKKPILSQSALKAMTTQSDFTRRDNEYNGPTITLESASNHQNLTLEETLVTLEKSEKEGSICRYSNVLYKNRLPMPIWKISRKLSHLDYGYGLVLEKDPIERCWTFLENHLFEILRSVGISSKDVCIRASGVNIDDKTQKGKTHLSVTINKGHGFCDKMIKALWTVINAKVNNIKHGYVNLYFRLLDLNTGVLLSDYSLPHKIIWDGDILKWEDGSCKGVFTRDDEYKEQCENYRDYVPRTLPKEVTDSNSEQIEDLFRLNGVMSTFRRMIVDYENIAMDLTVSNEKLDPIAPLYSLNENRKEIEIDRFEMSMGLAVICEFWLRTGHDIDSSISRYRFGMSSFRTAEEFNSYVRLVKDFRLAEKNKITRAKSAKKKKTERYWAVYDVELFESPVLVALVKSTYQNLNPTGYLLKNYVSLRHEEGYWGYNSLISVPASTEQIKVADSILADNPTCYKKIIWFSLMVDKGYFIASKYQNGVIENKRWGYNLHTDNDFRKALHPMRSMGVAIEGHELNTKDSPYVMKGSDCSLSDLKRICIMAHNKYILNYDREVSFDNFAFSIGDNGEACIAVDSKNNCGFDLKIRESGFEVSCNGEKVTINGLVKKQSAYRSISDLLRMIAELSTSYFSKEDKEDSFNLIYSCGRGIISVLYDHAQQEEEWRTLVVNKAK